MAYHIAICDDNSTDARYLSKLLEDWARQREIRLHTDAFPSAEAFLFHYGEKKDYDILLLDIELFRVDGVILDCIEKNTKKIQFFLKRYCKVKISHVY